MTPRVSVHICAKETTPLGKLFFQCCLQALQDSNWPDEIIIVDDGCSKPVVELYMWFAELFRNRGVPVTTASAGGIKTYAGLRNKALELTDRFCTVMHWIDTDEVYFPDQLNALKRDLEHVPDFRQAYTYFYHFINNPLQWQFKATKDNIFRFSPTLKWEKGVHEKMTGLVGTAAVQTNVQYLHFGYIRPQWQTCLKWLHYDMIEHGNVDRYKDERFEDADKKVYTKPWFREWRTPNTILDDRIPVCKEQGPWDVKNVPAAARPIYEHANEWDQFLLRIEDHSFWNHWEYLAKAPGLCNWRETLDQVVKEMTECGWSYDGKKYQP